ncbi:MAG: ferrous iron transport protein B, partial [Coriobacteriales bacterium]|nr:ferrous iron transport protein B [Coriobacteriales bacterium]
MKRYALIGNPNAGKTTLFNELTGTSQHVGNWPGVTVEKKTGHLLKKFGESAEIVDLPGIYSLNAHSLEERISRDFILQEKPDVVIDIVEATNIERNLYLTCQIAELGVPMVVALNMMDEAQKEGDVIDCAVLSKELGVPVVPITAVKGEGVIELMETVGAQALVDAVSREASQPFHDGEDEHGHGFHDTEDPAEHRADHHTDDKGRTNALISEFKYHNHYHGPMVYQPSADAPLTDEQEHENAQRRYDFISGVVGKSVSKGKAAGEFNSSDKADKVLTHKIWGIPLFLLIMFAMFHCTFSENFLFLGLDIPSPGVWLQGLAESFIEWLGGLLEPLFVEGSWAQGLVIDGIIGGVGSVLSFLPQILVLFFFLTLLEDMGYMARAAFIMDRLLRKFGLSGKSFVPMLMGFGCSVPALMACRTMENEEDRKMTLFLTPFMSCGARAPIFLVFAGAFFAAHADFIVFCLYLFGILVAILTGLLLKKLVFKGEVTPLIIELPRYRAPRAKSVGLSLWKTMKDYVTRAGTIIFLMSIVIWFFSTFNGHMEMVDIDESMLAAAGNFIAPIFSPLGFGFWTAGVALITGFAAKEAVIGTMGVLAKVGEEEALEGGALDATVLGAMGFTPLSSFAFMVFSLLYVPCFAALAT